jgi:uncharacterized protein
MAMTRRRWAVPVVVAMVVAGTAMLSAFDIDAQWKSDLLAWRAHRVERLTAPDGWLTLVGLEWLKPGANTVGSAADNRIRLSAAAPAHLGVIEVKGNDVEIGAPAGGFPADVKIDGAAARAQKLGDDRAPKPTVISAGTISIYLLQRGYRYALRIKDSQAATRLNFRGLHWYAPDPKYRVEAKWIPVVPPQKLKIATMIGTTDEMTAPGIAEFTLDGQTFRIQPVIEEPGDKQLFVILRDTTSRTTTYGAGRFMYADFPDHGLDKPGHLTLDFNRLYNPPCAFTPYATCPLPPEQNRLSIALPVGEERYSH